MIPFQTTAKVKGVPRASQLTTEAYLTLRRGRGHRLPEPSRYGINSQGRYTILRVATEAEALTEVVDFWVEEARIGEADFERLLALEVGDRVKLAGRVVSQLEHGKVSLLVERARVLS